MLTEAQKASIKERLAKNPGILFETLAESNDASEAEMIECLPEELWSKASGNLFQEILTRVATWGKVMTIIHTVDAVFEFSGPFPAGEEGHGFYNLDATSGFQGHLRYKNCGAIYFITRPFRGSETRSILFANHDGGIMFKIFLGRDENRIIFPEQIEKFQALAKEFKA